MENVVDFYHYPRAERHWYDYIAMLLLVTVELLQSYRLRAVVFQIS